MLELEGLRCAGCEGTVQRALEGVDGVSEASVSYSKNQAVVCGTAAVDDLIAAIELVGPPTPLLARHSLNIFTQV